MKRGSKNSPTVKFEGTEEGNWVYCWGSKNGTKDSVGRDALERIHQCPFDELENNSEHGLFPVTEVSP